MFGPLTPPATQDDYLAWASFETLRSVARAAGLKAKRSKRETAGALRAALDSSSLKAAATEGCALWNKYEWAPYSLTPFAVLECTIASIEGIAQTCALLLRLPEPAHLRWVTNNGRTVCGDCASMSNKVASKGAILDHPDWVPPLHPGCTCAVIFDFNNTGQITRS